MKTFIQILIVLLLQDICFQHVAFAQDTLNVPRSEKRVKHKFQPEAIKATMLSVAFPGMGQLYNRKYWKLPIVYGGFGGLVYAIRKNTSFYAQFMKAYQDFTDPLPETNSFLNIKGFENIDPSQYDPVTNPQGMRNIEDQLLRQVDYYKRYRDLSYIGVGILYIATILDANVDASLFNYDVSNDLDIAVGPMPIGLPDGNVGAGVNVSLVYNF